MSFARRSERRNGDLNRFSGTTIDDIFRSLIGRKLGAFKFSEIPDGTVFAKGVDVDISRDNYALLLEEEKPSATRREPVPRSSFSMRVNPSRPDDPVLVANRSGRMRTLAEEFKAVSPPAGADAKSGAQPGVDDDVARGSDDPLVSQVMKDLADVREFIAGADTNTDRMITRAEFLRFVFTPARALAITRGLGDPLFVPGSTTLVRYATLFESNRERMVADGILAAQSARAIQTILKPPAVQAARNARGTAVDPVTGRAAPTGGSTDDPGNPAADGTIGDAGSGPTDANGGTESAGDGGTGAMNGPSGGSGETGGSGYTDPGMGGNPGNGGDPGTTAPGDLTDGMTM